MPNDAPEPAFAELLAEANGLIGSVLAETAASHRLGHLLTLRQQEKQHRILLEVQRILDDLEARTARQQEANHER